MKRIMCVRLTSWPTDRVKRRRPALRELPLALYDASRRQLVTSACPLARAGGVRVGMTLAEANALYGGLKRFPPHHAAPQRAATVRERTATPSRPLPHGHGSLQGRYEEAKLALAHHPADARQDLRSLEGLGRWLMARVSPQVALEPPESIFVEIGGSARLFGGIETIVRRVTTAIAAMRIAAVISVAPTAGAAWALAASGRAEWIDEPAVLAALHPLAVWTLRVEPDVSDALHHVGVATIGQLIRLPRSTLPARFGARLLDRIDHATGRLPEPLTWLQPRSPVRERVTFEGVVDSLETVWHVLECLMATIVAELSKRGSGARQLRVRFDREKPPPLVQTVTLSRPSRDAKHMMTLLRLALETLRAREGFVAIELGVPELQRIKGDQTTFVAEADADASIELADLISRLRAKLCDAAITRPVLVASHIPERAFTRADAIDSTSATKVADRISSPRPLCLLPRPVEIAVIVSPSHVREGRPVALTHDGRSRLLRFAVGPERISGEWWTGHDKTRDYFDVEDETGRRLWVFRVMETFKWYLHGGFG